MSFIPCEKHRDYYDTCLVCVIDDLRNKKEIDKSFLRDRLTDIMIESLGAVMYPPDHETDTATIMNTRKDMLIYEYMSCVMFNARVNMAVASVLAAMDNEESRSG